MVSAAIVSGRNALYDFGLFLSHDTPFPTLIASHLNSSLINSTRYNPFAAWTTHAIGVPRRSCNDEPSSMIIDNVYQQHRGGVRPELINIQSFSCEDVSLLHPPSSRDGGGEDDTHAGEIKGHTGQNDAHSELFNILVNSLDVDNNSKLYKSLCTSVLPCSSTSVVPLQGLNEHALVKEQQSCKMLQNISSSKQPCQFRSEVQIEAKFHSIGSASWKRVGEDVLQDAILNWLKSIKRENIDAHNVTPYNAWMELIQGVRQFRFRNCFLGGANGLQVFRIDGKMTSFAGMSWFNLNNECFILWRDFARRVVVQAGPAILHAFGPVYRLAECVNVNAEPLSSLWSVGLRTSQLPTGVHYLCQYVKRMIETEELLTRRQTFFTIWSSSSLRTRKKRLENVENGAGNPSVLNEESRGCPNRLQLKENVAEDDFNCSVLHTKVCARFLRVMCQNKELGIGTFEGIYNTFYDLNKRLNEQVVDHTRKSNIVNEQFIQFQNDPVSALRKILDVEEPGDLHDVCKFRQDCENLNIGVLEFARIHVLSVLVWDHSLHASHKHVIRGNLCKDESIFRSCIDLQLLSASGWRVPEDDNSFVESWENSDRERARAYIDRNGHWYSLLMNNNDQPPESLQESIKELKKNIACDQCRRPNPTGNDSCRLQQVFGFITQACHDCNTNN